MKPELIESWRAWLIAHRIENEQEQLEPYTKGFRSGSYAEKTIWFCMLSEALAYEGFGDSVPKEHLQNLMETILRTEPRK